MSRELICAEDELSIALNKTERYIEFLENSIQEYREILSAVTTDGVEDALIRTQISRISQQLLQIRSELGEIMPDITDSIRKQISDLEEADHFTYPDVGSADLFSLLAGFL